MEVGILVMILAQQSRLDETKFDPLGFTCMEFARTILLLIVAASFMGLMMLAAGKGETIKVITDGVDAEAAMADLEELVNTGFGDVE
jgi:hypothetical protein